ncbi:inter-alpha-trypsin inhibitor heavy chain H3 isoform X2 [Triplophysa dalaica]|nr:inter-alpha-trypsin inhibitor heavy chain H3 isoform X2 [Triplophysa dalaica]
MDRAAFRLILWGCFLISVYSSPVTRAQNVDVYSFHMNSTVTSRYATTTITSRVANKLNESQEILFEVKIPKNAFISKFRMIIEGTSYDGVVKEKAEAQQQYTQAVSRGQSAGLIKSVGRTLEEFKTSVTVAALSKVTFELTYEELLKRRLGKYELLINAQPMQTVTDFKIDVHVHEKTGISFLEVKGDLSTDDLTNAIKTTRADKDAWVTFYPTRDQQTKCKTCGENGLNGDLLITYDVERQNPNGEMTVSNGYFFHSFAPSDVSRISKNVVFIIDRSGSMHGKKMQQTRLALLKILSDLGENDHFGLITFDSRVDLWKRELLKATHANLEDAKSFVKKITDRGATDINAAVLEGVDMIKRHPREGTTSILILLTDGDPTSGETNTEKITGNVKVSIGSKFPLYCLGFGYDVNFDFLTKMSMENNGVARRIYEDSDADLQLQGFYDEVAVPLLTDIQLNYIGVSNLTQTSFNLYFNGSEIVVSGQITDNSVESVTTEIIAISKGSKVTYRDTVTAKDVSDVQPEHDNFLERLWAYLTVKQLLDRQVLLKGPEKEASKKEALNLSLKYQFVTSLTSMVVTKPQENQTEVADKPKEGATPHRPPAQRPVSHGFALLAIPEWKPLDSQMVVAQFRPASPGQRHPGSSGRKSYSHPGGVLVPDPRLTMFPKQMAMVDPPSDDTDGVSMDIAPAVRFLIPADGQPKPLCFDVPLPFKLKLLQDFASE